MLNSLQILVYNSCVLCTTPAVLADRHLALTGGTDGRLVFWDISAEISQLAQKDFEAGASVRLAKKEPCFAVKAHQSGVSKICASEPAGLWPKYDQCASVAAATVVVNDDLIFIYSTSAGSNRLLVVTGGDDNSVVAQSFSFSILDSDALDLQLLSKCVVADAHSSSITSKSGLKLCGVK